MLSSDPLQNLSRLGADLEAVVTRGRWLDAEARQGHLDALIAKSAALTPQVIEIEDAIKSGDLDAARAAFDAIRAEDPEEVAFSQYVPFFIGYGFLYGEGGYSKDPERLQAALTLYTMYAETYPEYHSAHYMLALALEANGDSAGALERLDRAIELHPAYPDGLKKHRELMAEMDPEGEEEG